MRDLYKQSFKLRVKGSDALQQNRPAGSSDGVCLVCGRFMEYLNEQKRCCTPECNDLLKKLCMERGLALQSVDDDAQLWTALQVDPIIAERIAFLGSDVQTDHHALDRHTCKCKRALKMPRAPQCMHCYREGRVVQAKVERSQRTRKRAEKPVANKIKGLDRIKL